MRKIRNQIRFERRIKWAGAVSSFILLTYILYQSFFPNKMDYEQERACMYMNEMKAIVAEHCNISGIPIDISLDPELTGLVGPEWSEITSTIGHADVKRTSIQSEFASLLVTLLREAGVKSQDTIALACSGSFPGLMLASLSAAKSLGVECKTILSLGSSSFGANRPDFTILDIYLLLLQNGLIEESLIAISLGGEQDQGLAWDAPVIKELKRKVMDSGYPFILEEELAQSVRVRSHLLGIQETTNLKALINSGGAMANIGTSETILGLKPGLVSSVKIPSEDKQGLVHSAAQNNIPIIHLLYIKGLAIEYGIQWDPPSGIHAE